MQPAFLMFRILPPPAAGTQVLSGFYRAGAGSAADTRISPVMQDIIRNIVLPDIIPDLIFRPIKYRIHLKELELVIPFNTGHFISGN